MLHDITQRVDHVFAFAEPHRAGLRRRRNARAPRRRRCPAATRARMSPPPPPPLAVSYARAGHFGRSRCDRHRRAESLADQRGDIGRGLRFARRCRPSSGNAGAKRSRRSPPTAGKSGTSGRGARPPAAPAAPSRERPHALPSPPLAVFPCTTRGRSVFGALRATRVVCPRCSAGYRARNSAAAAMRRPSTPRSRDTSVGLASSRPAIFNTSCFTNGASGARRSPRATCRSAREY